jgi:hypothetical protein
MWPTVWPIRNPMACVTFMVTMWPYWDVPLINLITNLHPNIKGERRALCLTTSTSSLSSQAWNQELLLAQRNWIIQWEHTGNFKFQVQPAYACRNIITNYEDIEITDLTSLSHWQELEQWSQCWYILFAHTALLFMPDGVGIQYKHNL